MSLARVAGQVITFYSYKGGTGRSMALANTACLLAQRSPGRGVLMVDWDLEAPGLHRYFQDFRQQTAEGAPQSLSEQPGLIDLMRELDARSKQRAETVREPSEDDAVALLDELPLEPYITETTIPSLSLMTAGRFDGQYSTHVNTFQWEEFYTRSPWLMRKFAERLSERFDYVLVDSRTGYTDVSGICTSLLPERLVLAFTPNRQSLAGVIDLARSAVQHRRQSDDLRPLLIFPLVSRVESAAEVSLHQQWRYGNAAHQIEGYQKQFETLFSELYRLPTCDLTSYFDVVQIQHVPRYAYGEEIAALLERPEDRLSLARSYEHFLETLTTLDGPWESIGGPIEVAAIEQPTRIAQHIDTGGGVFVGHNVNTDGGDFIGRDQVIHGDQIRGYTAAQVAALIEQIRSTFQPRPFDGRWPYPGLAAFDGATAEFYFGQERWVADLLNQLATANCAVITGASGSGKSSLVRAGLMPALEQGALPTSAAWRFEAFAVDADPLDALARLVTSQAGSLGAGEDFRGRVLNDPTMLHEWLAVILRDEQQGRVLLFVDQFEQLFLLDQAEPERQAFVATLVHAATVENSRLTLVLALRADLLPACAAYPALAALVAERTLRIGAPSAEELARAATQPALQVGLPIDPALVARLINELVDEPAPLPLLQLLLRALREESTSAGGVTALSLAGLLEQGGLHGCLARHADRVMAGLSTEDQKLVRRILPILIEPLDDEYEERRTVLLDELLLPGVERRTLHVLLTKLAAQALVVLDAHEAIPTVTLSHPALISAWSELRQLISADRAALLFSNRISLDAQIWEQQQREASYLYRGAHLRQVQQQLADSGLELNTLAASFMRASISTQEAEQTVEANLHQQLRRWRTLALLGALVILTLLIWQIWTGS